MRAGRRSAVSPDSATCGGASGGLSRHPLGFRFLLRKTGVLPASPSLRLHLVTV